MLQIMWLVTLLGLEPAPELRCVGPRTFAGDFARASAVFSGTVVGREYERVEDAWGGVPGRAPVPGRQEIVRLAVDRVWKGDVGAQARMVTSEVLLDDGSRISEAHGFTFQDGVRYLVFAFGPPDRLRTSICWPTKAWDAAQEELRELGPGRAP